MGLVFLQLSMGISGGQFFDDTSRTFGHRYDKPNKPNVIVILADDLVSFFY